MEHDPERWLRARPRVGLLGRRSRRYAEGEQGLPAPPSVEQCSARSRWPQQTQVASGCGAGHRRPPAAGATPDRLSGVTMFERFTDRARRVVVLAQEEARMLNHNYIGTEHILLGLIHEGEGVAAKALETLDISLDAVREQVQEIIGQGQQSPTGHIPFTPRAKKVLELSLREGLQLGP